MRAAAIAAVVLIAGVVSAAVIVEQETFTDSDGSWTDAGYGTYVAADAIGGRDDVVQITTPGDAQPHLIPYLAEDGISATDFSGNYETGAGVAGGSTPIVGISFDFYVDPGNTAAPSELNIYFTATSGRSWRWSIDNYANVQQGTWQTFGANIAYDAYDPGGSWGAWSRVGAASSDLDWAADIETIQDIGIEIGYLVDGTAETIGFDNFTLYDDDFLVPEPETYLVLGMALLSVAVVFRKRITESLAEARAMLMV